MWLCETTNSKKPPFRRLCTTDADLILLLNAYKEEVFTVEYIQVHQVLSPEAKQDSEPVIKFGKREPIRLEPLSNDDYTKD